MVQQRGVADSTAKGADERGYSGGGGTRRTYQRAKRVQKEDKMENFYPGGYEQAQQFAQKIESGELTRLRFTKHESRIYVFQGAGRHLGGASGTSTRAPPRLNDDEMRAARRRRFDPTAAAVKSQEVIVIDDD